MFTSLRSGWNASVSGAPLAVFRIGFGLMMLASIIRFWAYGWIEKLYLEPVFFFSYTGFSWVKPLGPWTYGLFFLAAAAAAGIVVGWKYRLSASLFFLSFTYIELMDKTTYLNHYYFISLLSFALIWLPAANAFSLDRRGKVALPVSRWTITALKVFVGVVYFYAGLAKLNSDWLFKAQPLSIWLPAKYKIPLLGDLLQQPAMHYLFAWSGALYDLLIPFLLLWRPTRWVAFGMVVIFHVLTRVLFPIGMFPYIMIVSALIFFDDSLHERLLRFFTRLPFVGTYRPWIRQKRARPQVQGKDKEPSEFGVPYPEVSDLSSDEIAASVVPNSTMLAEQGHKSFVGFSENINDFDIKRKYWMSNMSSIFSSLSGGIVGLLLLLHLLLPWRYLMYPGELFWTESGYRFSWRVMLMEKAGYAAFSVVDPDTGHRKTIVNRDYLTTFQEKQMSTQPDFILEFAHYLAHKYQQEGRPLPAVYVESYVALNGRGSRPYVNPEIDLTTIRWHTPRTEWLLPFADDIHGL